MTFDKSNCWQTFLLWIEKINCWIYYLLTLTQVKKISISLHYLFLSNFCNFHYIQLNNIFSLLLYPHFFLFISITLFLLFLSMFLEVFEETKIFQQIAFFSATIIFSNFLHFHRRNNFSYNYTRCTILKYVRFVIL